MIIVSFGWRSVVLRLVLSCCAIVIIFFGVVLLCVGVLFIGLLLFLLVGLLCYFVLRRSVLFLALRCFVVLVCVLFAV